MVVSQEAVRALAGWAHDLGKPLQIIGDHGRRLADEESLEESARHRALEIVSLSEEALRVVERLIERGRADGDGLRRPWRSVPRDALRSILRRVAVVCRGLHPEALPLIRGEVPGIWIDRSSPLPSVLVNLVDNAIRASARSQQVTIAARIVGQSLVIEVADRGRGMSALVLENAFEPYFTTRPSPRSRGLGLWHCKSLIQSIGGQIRLESIEGEGTRAIVVVPLARFEEALEPKRIALRTRTRPAAIPVDSSAPPRGRRRS